MNFYETTMVSFVQQLYKLLSENYSEEIYSLKYSSQEQNLDGPLKHKIKEIILTNDFNLDGITIKNVYIGSEVKMNEEAVKALTTATKVWTNPDLCIEFSDGTNNYYETIELKSTKDDTILGSSYKQVKPDEWTIFILHDVDENGKATGDIAIGKYVDAIIPDQKIALDIRRRDKISFSVLKESMLDNFSLSIPKGRKEKQNILDNGNQKLAEEAVKNVSKSNTTLFEKLVNKIALELLKKFEKMTEEERAELKARLEELN